MALKFRGKEIFKPLNTGRIDERVSCIREYVANIFFYTKKVCLHFLVIIIYIFCIEFYNKTI